MKKSFMGARVKRKKIARLVDFFFIKYKKLQYNQIKKKDEHKEVLAHSVNKFFSFKEKEKGVRCFFFRLIVFLIGFLN